MNPLILGPVLEIGRSLLERLFPDPAERAKAEAEWARMQMDDSLRRTLAQLEINAREAQSPSLFVSGWRPGAGWCGVAGLAYATIGHPLLSWIASAKGWAAPPAVDVEVLLYVLGGMLGLGTLRTVEKAKGVASR